MSRCCAILVGLPARQEIDPCREIDGLGGRLAAHGDGWALAIVPGERPADGAGPFHANGLVAVGEVTLFNRAAILAELTRPPAPLPAMPQGSPLTGDGGALSRPVAAHPVVATGREDGLTDGELLLRFLAQVGPAGLARVNGMFALVVWDGSSLLLARDAVGARTLFYTRVGDTWAVASSLRALRRWPRLPVRTNLAAVRSFLTFAYLPGDETLLEGVHELRPACWLRLPSTATPSSWSLQPRSYWEPAEPVNTPTRPFSEYVEELTTVLEAATAARLPAGQPVGLFLSGGLDSSLITALAARQHDRPLQTYSINFGAELPNELAYSGLVAAHCQTNHRVLTFSGRQIAAHLAEAVALLDCPVGDPLTVPNLLLARAAAADGLRVILNGEGGDPVFGGPKNLPMMISELHREKPSSQARATTYLQSYRKCYDELPRLLTPAVQAALRDAPPVERLVQPFLEAPQMASFLNRLLYTNLRTKGAHHILTKVERLTAASGLEGRAPLFDPAVIDAAFAIPPIYKLHGTIEKWVLKGVARRFLPSLIVDRPKSGMRVPVQHWLRGPLRELANDLLLGPVSQSRGLFQPATIREWSEGRGLLWPRHGGSLWLVLTLELWLRAYIDHAEIDHDYFAPRRRRWGWQARLSR